ncbi:MAG: hypothetical protein MZV64_19230 [Ignavibacteriales bacterium]|nr:hypothetical protein [Ignavibacteriales bacterium]
MSRPAPPMSARPTVIIAWASWSPLSVSTTLVLISLGIFYGAWRRFISPPEVQSECTDRCGSSLPSS